ncbi:non-ribosomal peptide synthase/polyketide synthase [Pseudomonas proteolytica]|uniref:non-ribosomal peptide synthase/polyketide synthase n=1 Tax=Pseudomonas proteolytica TaxID=219574 RepID=UPI001473DCC1|nr:non-ribosomal peptide synthase/polyketide synthase [Pseudomonas proteolytica]NMZ08064.1 non-ribosomal peptide synthase/polyketide synthase [Pseudomonas proteolytica]
MNQLNQLPDDDLLALLLADEAGAGQSIQSLAGHDPVPLSFAQQRLWFLQQFDPQSHAYNLPRAIALKGPVDARALEAALNRVIDRHDILRTAFRDTDGTPLQVIEPGARLTLLEEDLSTLDNQQRDLQLQQRIRQHATQPFDLRQAPLIRSTLLKQAEQDYVLLLNMHHIVSDAWSNPILIHDLASALREPGQALPRPAIQYADYAQWQRQDYPLTPQHSLAAQYWKTCLGDEIPTLELPRERLEQHAGAGHHGHALPALLSERLQTFCQQQGLTPFVVLLGAWQLLLGRYSGQVDFTVGVPNATRNQAQIQDLVGFFVSSQVYRARLAPEQTCSAFLQGLRQQSLAALEHADYPIELILEDLHLQRSPQANPLFQTLFNWRVGAVQEAALHLGPLQLSFMDSHPLQAKFELSLDVEYSQQQITAHFEYDAACFAPATIATLAGHFQNLVHAMLEQPQARIGELPMLSAEERGQQLAQWNATAVHYANAAPVHVLFADQAERLPHAVAVEFGEQQLTLDQLNRRANQLAHKLLELGVGPNTCVGLGLERSLEMVIALLAVLKAGGAYVPLDPAYPADRLAYMINDSGIGLLLTQSSLALPVPDRLPSLSLDQDSDWLEGYDSANPPVTVSADHLAYMIYTSGSTGQPKGVQVRHGALTNHMLWMQGELGLSAADRVLQKTAFSFDASVWEFWLPLLNGAQLVLASSELSADLSMLWSQVAAQRISVLQMAPSLLQALLADEQGAQMQSLRLLLLGGEALCTALVTQLRERWNGRLCNLYGPTEATIDTTLFDVDRLPEGAIAPIGRPIANVRTYLLDHDLQLCPVGTHAELLIGGDSLAQGYHQRPGLTAERFIPDPFAGNGARLYRSGDLTRYRADGVIDYIGRIDHQVKIRGLRIELGEIEAQLLQHQTVREAVVIAHPAPGGAQLVGYVVPTEPATDITRQDALRDTLKAHLGEHLPDYMVPGHLLILAQLPLTPNGKLDRKALPAPDANQALHAYVAPQNEVQQRIAGIWQDVLKLEKIGLNDNFFELGGDSIISIQVVSRARQAGIHFTPKDLFQHQTIQGLASVAKNQGQGLAIDQGPVTGLAPLLPIQHLFFDTDIPERHHWNQSVLLKPATTLDPHLLEQALNALIQHHDALRLRFTQTDSGWNAEYRPQTASVLWQTHIDDATQLQSLGDEAQRSLDLQHGPLLRAVLVGLKDGSQRLLLAIHHLVVDGVSWRILFDDLQMAYRQVQAGQGFSLPEKTSAYKAWGQRLLDYGQSAELQGQIAYWQQLADGCAELPVIRADASLRKADSQTVNTHLNQDLTRRLLQDAPSAYRTQINDLLLAALARVISRWTAQPQVLIQLEGHGRETLFDDIDLTRTVGWFTTVYPVRLTPQSDHGTTIKQIKEQLRSIPNKGLDFGVLRYLGTPETRQVLQALPVPRITFNYLGQFDTSFNANDDALFAPAPESSGAEHSPEAPLSNWLTLNGQVYDGELSLGWTFSAQMFEPARMQALADDYAEELAQLIEHCCAPHNRGVTPSDFPLANLDQAQLDALPVAVTQIDDIYPLAPMQQGMLFHSLYEQNVGAYVNQMRLNVTGLDPQGLRDAWQQAMDAHDILRTSFVWQGELQQPVQVVHKQLTLPMVCHDWQQRADLQPALDKLARERLQQRFDLARAPLLDVQVIQTGEAQHHLIYTVHHILMDGWSNSQLMGEILQRYAGQTLPARMGRYRDYIAWLQRQDSSASQTWWAAQLATLQEPTRLASSLVSVPTTATGHGNHYQHFGIVETRYFNEFARRQKVTLNTLLQGAWLLLLHHYTGQDSLCFGATVAGRPTEIAGIEQQVGLFINTLPVIATVNPQTRVDQWLQAVQTQNLSLREHEHTSLADIQRWAGHNGEALFDTLLVFENYPIADALEQQAPKGLEFGHVDTYEQTNYPLTLAVNAGETLSLHYSFAHDAFTEAVIERMAQHLHNLLLRLTERPDRAIGELNLLDDSERAQVVHRWNDTARHYPLERPVQALIEHQVEQTPDAPALIYADVRLSYAQLNARANQLAHHLIALGVGPDRLVGIALERSVEMVVGLLAILKAGGAYVPLDPEYPTDRLAYMIDDSGIDLLLTQQSLLSTLPLPATLHTLCLDTLALDALPDTNPGISVAAENLAYVIYTSGSTGKPKGAGNRHSALTNRLCWMQQAYGLSGDDTVLQKTPFSFDVSVWEFFWPLMTGARLAVAGPGDHRDPQKLVQLITEHQVTTLHFVPSMLQAFLQDDSSERCTGLTRIICSGEALQVDTQQQVFARLPGAGLYNLYGPTEAAIDVTHWTCREEQVHTVPIGQPIANLSTFVLNSELAPLPVGLVGELYLGGEGLARGYHRRAGMTAERFVASPFTKGQRLYRTGDLARQRADGVIEYIGRVDHQVKIRGLRIELGEIEARLLEQDEVREAAVLAVDSGRGLQLVGYVVPSANANEALRDTLRHTLKEHLPDYMVPALWVFLDALPLSPNGKLDRKALPAPDASQVQVRYVAPQSELEQQIADIWQDVLKVQNVGLTDNFFELGGDSIISIQVVSRARQAGIQFSPKELFEAQTVQQLATLARTGTPAQEIDQQPLTGPTPLLPVQQAFFQRAIPERHHWNQAVLLSAHAPLQADALEQALQALLLHHDGLRLSFSANTAGWQANYRSVAQQQQDWQQAPALQQASTRTTTELEELCNQVQASLDLSQGPLLQAVLVTLADNSQRLLLVAHHLVIDGVSWRILLEDLQTAYQQACAVQIISLPVKTHSSKTWAEHLQRHATQGSLAGELAYWQAQLKDAQGTLPGARCDASLENRHGHSVNTRLDKALTRQLLQEAPAAYRTQINDLLLTALARVISRWTHHPQCLIQLEGHGREELFEPVDLTRTVGWFTSLFPVALAPVADDLGASIKQIKEQLRAIPNKGIGFGALRYLGDAQARERLAALPEPRVTFNYLGQFDGSFSADEQALFSPAGEGTGAEQSPEAPLGNWLTLNGQIYAGELSLNWLFSREMFDDATIQHLADDYAAELRALVAHCIDPAHRGLTPSDVPLATIGQAQLDRLPIPAAQIADLYPLSPMQQGMLFHSLYEQGTGTGTGNYINQLRVDIDGLDPQRFQQAWQAAMDNHDILRTGFVWQGLEHPLQWVLKQAQVPFTVYALGSHDAPQLDALALAELQRPFELDQAPLLRLVLVQTGAERYHLIYTVHHILMDGWSNSQLMGQVLQHYSGQVVTANTGRYRDYIAWLQQQDSAASQRFWQEQLRDLESPTLLGQSVAQVPGEGHGEYRKVIDPATTERLNTFARQQKVTTNTLVQAAWLLLLQRYTGQATVCFGATVAGRPAQLNGVEQQIGLFINTLPVAASPRPEQSVAQWLQQVQAQNLSLREHEHTPLFETQRQAGVGGESLFDNILVFENYPISEALEQGAPQGLRFGPVHSHEQTNYPLTLSVGLGASLTLQYSYVRANFSDALIEQIARHMDQLLNGLMNNAERALGSLNLLDKAEQTLILNTWNSAPLSVADEQCIHHLIDRQTQATPGQLALIDGDQHLSYQQLDQRANRLAHKLIELGVGPEVRVGVAMPRTSDLLVALLAVLKAGGTYVPLDPDYPADRVAYMLEDSRARLLLVGQQLPDELRANAITQVLTIEPGDAWLAGYSGQQPVTTVTPENLAYVIYTSGSTGLPKGVAIAHRNVSALVRWSAQVYSPDDLQGVLASTSICFDLSVWELFVTLACGGSIVLARNALELPTLPARDQVRLINTVPSAINALQRAGQIPDSVRIINLAGEPLKQALVDTLYAQTSVAHIYDLYGPSEDTTYSTWTRREVAGSANIGRPVGNTASYLLTQDLQPAPLGVAAELYLAGAGITRGYLGRAALTAEKFVPNPFSGSGERLYRTSDLTRYRQDGVIEYIGRIDHQVKIRGFRIELGEIESRLLQHPEVREAVVLAQEHLDGQQLVAYVVTRQSLPDAASQDRLRTLIKARLQENLPAYMVPAHLLFLDQIPLTPNGKLDRKALPTAEAVQSQRAFVAPQTPLQQQMADIWQQVLELERVGLDDNFFELGGHSLLVVRVVSRAQLELGMQLTPQQLFQFPTLGAFVSELQSSGGQFDTEKLSKLEALLDDMEQL